jgi:hypothetical protein
MSGAQQDGFLSEGSKKNNQRGIYNISLLYFTAYKNLGKPDLTPRYKFETLQS